MRVLMFLVFIITFSFSLMAQSLKLDDFVAELSSRQNKVEEFRYVREVAKRLGIKNVYMFGGTAAAWAHYVRWDMRREHQIEKLQKERFDYDYTNIFRANQDFDVVVDGTIEQASKLEKAIQDKFNYFSGTRPTWEVRLLNEQRSDKESILGFDFQNQHTDSHSTGLINMMECRNSCVLDVRDMNSERGQFLLDVFDAKLRYYFSQKHKETNRYKKKLNPPIISVIRYFTKAVQYGLEMRDEDIKTLKSIINNFNPKSKKNSDYYVEKWLEKNAKKLVMNAIDIEYALNLVRDIGLSDKLISMGDTSKKGSMSWWLNKEPLRTKTLGRGIGKKAGDIFDKNKMGEIIVSHETNNFSAFESITKAHGGYANVLISRDGVAGEAAVFGDGHYVRVGRSGARGTGLTIRYKLHPEAREKSDFTKHDDYLVVKNKAALEVIYEHMNLTAHEYFKKLLGGLSFDQNDKGVLEKLKRRVSRELNTMSEVEAGEIASMIQQSIENNEFKPAALAEWFQFNGSVKHIEVLQSLYTMNDYDELALYYINNSFSNPGQRGSGLPLFLADNVYSQTHWVERFPLKALHFWRDFVKQWLQADYTNVLGLDIWRTQHTDVFMETVLFKLGVYNHISVVKFISESPWVKNYLENNLELVKRILAGEVSKEITEELIGNVFKMEFWEAHPEEVLSVMTLKKSKIKSLLIENVITKSSFWHENYPGVINEILLNESDSWTWSYLVNNKYIDWETHLFDFSSLFKSNNGEARALFINHFLATDKLTMSFDELSRLYLLLDESGKAMFVKNVMTKESYYTNQKMFDLVMNDRSRYSFSPKQEMIKSVFSKSYFKGHRYLKRYFNERIDLRLQARFFEYVLKNEEEFSRFEKYVDISMGATQFPNYQDVVISVMENILKHKSSYKYDHWIDQILKTGEYNIVKHLISKVLTREHWKKHPRYQDWINEIIDKYPANHFIVVEKIFSKHGLRYINEVEKLLLLQDESTYRAISNLFIIEEWRMRTDIVMKVYDVMRRNKWYLSENMSIVIKTDDIKPLVRKYKINKIKSKIKRAVKSFCSNVYL